MCKFARWDVIDGRLSRNFDQDKIAAERLFDGCYIVSGGVRKEKMAAAELVASYKKLGLREEVEHPARRSFGPSHSSSRPPS
jgi:hypothetical protein